MQPRHRIFLFAGALLAALALCLPWKFLFSQGRSAEPQTAAGPTSSLATPVPEGIENKLRQGEPGAASGAPTPLDAKAELSAADKHKLETLHEILRSENDNDPRLDTELTNLGALKVVLRGEYAQIAPEKRNARGTIVYLLGRELESKDDILFMANVLSEQPCLSMQDCRLSPPPSADPDATTGTDVALAYPQIVAIKSLEAYLEKATAAGRKSATPIETTTALDALARGRVSDNPRVANWAAKTLERFSH